MLLEFCKNVSEGKRIPWIPPSVDESSFVTVFQLKRIIFDLHLGRQCYSIKNNSGIALESLLTIENF